MKTERRIPSIPTTLTLCLVLIAGVFSCTSRASSQSREMPAIVSPDWLAQRLDGRSVLVLDIRNPELYKKGHIPGAINIPLNLWAVSKEGLSLELPSDDALRDLLGKSGMTAASQVVVVNRIDTDFSRADPARVAWTLHVAGIDAVAILDGGYNRWVREKKPTATDSVNAQPLAFTGKTSRESFATKDYVSRKIDKSTIVDARVPEDYFGISSPPGHIRNAVNLPTPWMFENDGTFRKEAELRAMAAGVLGTHKSREVILYCGVGGYASAWWFVLTRMLGYSNVKVYDGSMEEWVKDPAAPVSSFSWR